MPGINTSVVKRPFKHWDLLCAGAFLAITVIIFSSFIFSNKMMVSSDQMGAVGQRAYTNNSFREHGQLPMWLNGRLGGMPTIDAKYGDIFYPPSALIRPFVSAHRFHGYTMVLHVFLAGALFFLMLRRSFGTARLTAFAGALFYMLSPQFVSHVNPGHDGKMFVIAWLPFVVWRLRSMLAKPTLRNAALFAIGVGMVILTGHVQMAYFVLMGVFLYWATDVVRGMVVDKDGKKKVAFKVIFFWAAVFVGLGIAFVQLWPSYMFVKEAHSVRGIDRGFEFATSWSMNWAEFFSLWVHEFGNSLEYYWGKNFFKLNTEYAGAVPLLLTVLALVSKPKSVWRILWAGIAVLAVIYSMGANTPIFSLFYHLIPGVRRFRAPSMIMFWFTFATALMAAIFIKDLIGGWFDGIKDNLRKKWTFGLWVALGCVTLVAAVFSSEPTVTKFAASMMSDMDPEAALKFKVNFSKNFVSGLWIWWLFTVVTLGMLLAVIYGALKPAALVYTLIVISFIDMARINSQFISVEEMGKYYYIRDPALERLKTEFDREPFRVFSWRGAFATQNQEDAYGLEGVGGFHDNELNCYRAFRGNGDLNYMLDIAVTGQGGEPVPGMARINGRTPFLDLANVGYVLVGTVRGGGVVVEAARNPTNLGRLSYAADFVVMDGEEKIVEALRRGSEYDYKTTVALLEEPELPYTRPSPTTQNVGADGTNGVDTDVIGSDGIDGVGGGDGDTVNTVDTDNTIDTVNTVNTVNTVDTVNLAAVSRPVKPFSVEWKRYTPNERIANVTMPKDGFLRISEVYYPGWVIKANGNPVKYYRSDVSWMAVPLTAGSYEIVMTPKSLYLDSAVWVTVICSVLVVGILAFAFIRRKQAL